MHAKESSRLFEHARQGSREAINAIFERYGDRLHALIRLRLGPQLRRRMESRDILQATGQMQLARAMTALTLKLREI